MSLEIGQSLGPYEISGRLGAGGMGEVYLARDTRLDRNVAVKVLPTQMAESTELRERFEREARTVSSLNHPHICALYDVGSQDGVDFLVMEHIEGETLAERLKKGPLPLDQALSRSIEIADALDKAHKSGVVHRDLKPGNVMLTEPGAKLLDFGLAKLAQPAEEASPVSSLPTEAKSLTAKGSILGTFQYMAPEQLEGEPVDARTDIFALGALIYEMVTGKKAFAGKSQASLITAIMGAEPEPASAVEGAAPPLLDHVIQRCLAKDPSERWQSAYDVVRELKWIQEGGSRARTQRADAPEKRGGFAVRALGFAFVAGAVLASLAFVALTRPDPSEPRPLKRFAVSVPEDVRLRGNVDVSADGRTIVATVYEGTNRRLYRRAIGQYDATPIPGTDDATGLTISPDGEWVAFTTAVGELKKVSLRGGPPVTLGKGGNTGLDWTVPDFILFAADGLVWQVSSAGGEARALTEPQGDGSSDRDPTFLPGGKAIVFRTFTAGASAIAVQSLETGERRVLVEGTSPRYASSGHLLFDRGGSIWGVPFDAEHLEIRGEPVPFVENVEVNASGFARYHVSAEGTLVYVPRQTSQLNQLVWVDREGRVEPLDEERRAYTQPRTAFDGRRAAVSIGGDESDVWIYEVERGTRVRLTTGDGRNSIPLWSPDAEGVFFSSSRAGAPGIYSRAANGSGNEELISPGGALWPYFVAPDGTLAIGQVNSGTSFDIAALSPDGEVKPLLATTFVEGNAVLSPDGRWMAYQTTESGAFEIQVQSFPDLGDKRVVSTDGGTEPAWSKDGSELFYRNDEQLMSVAVELGDELRLGEPRVLFQGAFAFADGGARNYDVSPDGERFLMIQSDDVSASRQIHVVLNFFDELERTFSEE